jgi:glycosyltransferase involved in cell wall biosynthesis
MAKMNVLWLINILLPEAAAAFGQEAPVIGGWLTAYRESLRLYAPDLHLTIVSPYLGTELRMQEVQGDRHYAFPERSTSQERTELFRRIIQEVQPNVVHIHGSEYPHSFDFLRLVDPRCAVLSIQGLVSVYTYYYYAGISAGERLRSTTLRDLIRREYYCQLKKVFRDHGRSEQRMIIGVGNVIGRTDWDRAHCQALHPDVRYYHCEEPLRQEFYGAAWDRSRCAATPTLFVSQANYPIKGLHQLLRALPLVLRAYPELQVHVAGDDLSQMPWYKRRSYGAYLRQLIDRYRLRSHVHFLGRLTAEQMREQYLQARIFVSPSSIENSSNSVCEAQLLGTPIVASNVGGMADLIEHRRTGLLYRFEEVEMLAAYICELLSDDDLCRRLSAAERDTAVRRHDRQHIAAQLHQIYTQIYQTTQQDA